MICEHLFHYKYLTNRLQFSVPVCRYPIIRLQMKSERVKSYKTTTRDEVEWEKYCCLRAVYRTLQYSTHAWKNVIHLFYTIKIQIV